MLLKIFCLWTRRLGTRWRDSELLEHKFFLLDSSSFQEGGQNPGKLILAETWTGRINPLLKLTESQQLMFSTASFLADVSINVCCRSRHLFSQVYDLPIPSYIAFKTLHISICSVDWVHTTHKTNWIEFNYHHSPESFSWSSTRPRTVQSPWGLIVNTSTIRWKYVFL